MQRRSRRDSRRKTLGEKKKYIYTRISVMKVRLGIYQRTIEPGAETRRKLDISEKPSPPDDDSSLPGEFQPPSAASSLCLLLEGPRKKNFDPPAKVSLCGHLAIIQPSRPPPPRPRILFTILSLGEIVLKKNVTLPKSQMPPSRRQKTPLAGCMATRNFKEDA